jgi:hypothetical protein
MQQEISRTYGFRISQDTVRRRLAEADLHPYTPAKGPLLTPDHRRQRLLFANEHLNWNLYSVEITYGINSVISKLMTFAENAETGKFLFLIMLILSYFTFSLRHPFLSYDVITNFFK